MGIMNHLPFALTLFSALGCGLIAGVFFAFSTFVMPALARLQPAQGIAAMQSINITVINPLFMGAFLGTAAACIYLRSYALKRNLVVLSVGGEAGSLILPLLIWLSA